LFSSKFDRIDVGTVFAVCSFTLASGSSNFGSLFDATFNLYNMLGVFVGIKIASMLGSNKGMLYLCVISICLIIKSVNLNLAGEPFLLAPLLWPLLGALLLASLINIYSQYRGSRAGKANPADKVNKEGKTDRASRRRAKR
jgi:hypothetical protein